MQFPIRGVFPFVSSPQQFLNLRFCVDGSLFCCLFQGPSLGRCFLYIPSVWKLIESQIFQLSERPSPDRTARYTLLKAAGTNILVGYWAVSFHLEKDRPAIHAHFLCTHPDFLQSCQSALDSTIISSSSTGHQVHGELQGGQISALRPGTQWTAALCHEVTDLRLERTFPCVFLPAHRHIPAISSSSHHCRGHSFPALQKPQDRSVTSTGQFHTQNKCKAFLPLQSRAAAATPQHLIAPSAPGLAVSAFPEGWIVCCPHTIYHHYGNTL